jgi:hypothetical protein
MDEQTTDATPPAPGKRGLRERIGQRPWVRSAALVGSGLVAGGILAGTVTATAADDGVTSAPSSAAAEDDRGGRHHGGGPARGEQALTGDTAASVEAAVLEEYPDATIERLETDADGVYEAHLTTADGDRVTVELGEDFAITGTE